MGNQNAKLKRQTQDTQAADGWLRIKDADSLSNNIVQVPNGTPVQLRQQCLSTGGCVGFNSAGWLKSAAPDIIQSPGSDFYLTPAMQISAVVRPLAASAAPVTSTTPAITPAMLAQWQNSDGTYGDMHFYQNPDKTFGTSHSATPAIAATMVSPTKQNWDGTFGPSHTVTPPAALLTKNSDNTYGDSHLYLLSDGTYSASPFGTHLATSTTTLTPISASPIGARLAYGPPGAISTGLTSATGPTPIVATGIATAATPATPATPTTPTTPATPATVVAEHFAILKSDRNLFEKCGNLVLLFVLFVLWCWFCFGKK